VLNYDGAILKYPNYELHIPSGTIHLNSINVVLGENGTGKTTFINWLKNNLHLDISIKEQTIDITKYKNNNNNMYPTVSEFLLLAIGTNFYDHLFQLNVIKALHVDKLYERKINELSGGELQKIMMVLCLGTNAHIYLLDEPSANLDIETRLAIIKIIKNFLLPRRVKRTKLENFEIV